MPDKLLSPEYGLSNSKLEECTANPSDVMNGKTFYSGDKTKKTGTFSFTGNATNARVVEGHTFYNNSKSRQTGTLTDRNTVGKNGCVGINSNYPNTAFSWGNTPQCTTLLDGARAFAIRAPYGYYDGNTYVGATQGDVASSIGLTADKIKSGQQILGITGTFTGDQPNLLVINKSGGWGEGTILSTNRCWTGPTNHLRMAFHWRAESSYNVDGFIRIMRNGSEVYAEGFQLGNGFIDKTFSQSGYYVILVRVDYHAGNGTFYIGGMMVGY